MIGEEVVVEGEMKWQLIECQKNGELEMHSLLSSEVEGVNFL